MIPPEILHRKSLFALLYKIDLTLAEQTRQRGCPTAEAPCTAPTTGASLGAGLPGFARHLNGASAYAAAVKGAGAGCCRHRFAFGAAGSIGHR